MTQFRTKLPILVMSRTSKWVISSTSPVEISPNCLVCLNEPIRNSILSPKFYTQREKDVAFIHLKFTSNFRLPPNEFPTANIQSSTHDSETIQSNYFKRKIVGVGPYL